MGTAQTHAADRGHESAWHSHDHPRMKLELQRPCGNSGSLLLSRRLQVG